MFGRKCDINKVCYMNIDEECSWKYSRQNMCLPDNVSSESCHSEAAERDEPTASE